MSSMRRIKYDPLVSDSACHTRAPYLVYLARKSKVATLSQEEQNYLEACEILTETQSRKLDPFGIILDERTDPSKIPIKYLPANASNTQKNTFLAQKKSLVAKTTLAFLQEGCKDLTLSKSQEAFTFNIPTSKQYIPVLPLYISAKMMLHYVAKQAIPLVVNLKRVRLADKQFVLDGAASLTYTFDSKNSQFAQQELQNDDEVIAIDMVSCYVKDTEGDVNGFLASSTFKAFMEVFCKEDIASLVMICAAGHAQYPKSAEPPQLKKGEGETTQAAAASSSSSSAAEKKEEDKVDVSTPLKVSLSQCEDQEYRKLASLARHYGFFRPEAKYVRLDLEKQKLLRPSTCLPFYIDHIYASTLKGCQVQTAQLLANQARLVADQEEELQPKKTQGVSL
jgi:hypothetical protein